MEVRFRGRRYIESCAYDIGRTFRIVSSEHSTHTPKDEIKYDKMKKGEVEFLTYRHSYSLSGL